MTFLMNLNGTPVFKKNFEHLSCPGLPDSGFYPEISGFFEAGGIFLGNFFLAKNLGKNLGNSQEKFT